MALRPSRLKEIEIDSFDPTLYSIQENKFLAEAAGKPPVVALREMPPTINIKAVKPIIERFYALEQLKEHEGLDWVGVEKIREAISAYLRENEKWKADKIRSRRAPRFPSLYSFDSRGRAHLGGVGSDSGRVRTYFDAKGNRVPFEISLIPDKMDEWVPPGVEQGGTEVSKRGLKVDNEKNRIECPVCGHAESYKAESRASYSAARARMSKHLRAAKDQVDDHREVHAEEFS